MLAERILLGDDRMKSATQRTPKKRYQPPVLQVYGDLTQMTKTSPTNPGTMEMVSGKPVT
jgi:hypothetical protein